MSSSIFSRPELVWFIIGLVLFLLELIIPGFVIIFFGIGAWITALLCLVANPGINLQVVVFAITSVIALLALRKIIQKRFFFTNDTNQNEIDDEFTGKEALAVTDFASDKTGKVEFKGTIWKAESKSEIKNGQRVYIIQKDNFKLIVEPINN